MQEYRIQHFGRLPPFHDPRDYSPEKAAFKIVDEADNDTTTLKAFKTTEEKQLPESDLKNEQWLPPVRDQGNLGSCVSFAWITALEYLHKMLYRRNIEFSQLYTYKMGRDNAFGTGYQGDTGLWLKHGIASLVRQGAVESHRYPYDISIFDEYPPAHLHTYADDFRAVKYFRLDYPNVPIEERLQRVNKYLASKWPVAAGFYCFETLDSQHTNDTGEVPYPSANESVIGGHAIFLYGYDVNKEITNPYDGSVTKGAWKFRNSWSYDWGDSGDGWLPFDYLTRETPNGPLADEFYSVTKGEWLNLQHFE
jgi:C1A family cysteine protease